MKERVFDMKNGCVVSCHTEKNYVKILNVLQIEKVIQGRKSKMHSVKEELF